MIVRTDTEENNKKDSTKGHNSLFITKDTFSLKLYNKKKNKKSSRGGNNIIIFNRKIYL